MRVRQRLIFEKDYGIIKRTMKEGGTGLERTFLVRVYTRQTINGETEEIRMETTGIWSGTADAYTLRYTEADGNLRGAVTLLQVENGKCVTVQREGDFESHMVIEENVRHVSQYVTPYGTFMLGVNASTVESAMDENGGTLRFRYSTDVDMVPLGEIAFEITLSENER